MNLKKVIKTNKAIYPRDIAKDYVDKNKVNFAKKKNIVDFLKKASFSFLAENLTNKNAENIVNKIDTYYKSLENSQFTKTEKRENLIENVVNDNLVEGIKEAYKGKKAIWLPSESDNPDPEHIINYGVEFYIDEGINGELPSERFGCKCGIQIIE